MQSTLLSDVDLASRRRRRERLLWAAMTALALVALLQGVALVRLRSVRNPASPEATLASRWAAALAGRPTAERRPVRDAFDNQVLCWETADDLDRIHAEISRALRTAGRVHSALAGQAPAGPPPTARLAVLQQEIERIFADANVLAREPGLAAPLRGGWDRAPATDGLNMDLSGSNYVVAIALPHAAKGDIRARIEGPPETRILVPDDADRGRIQAGFRDGLLRVTIARADSNTLAMPIPIQYF